MGKEEASNGVVCTTNGLTGEGYSFGAHAAASAINRCILISFLLLFVSGPNFSRSRRTAYLTHYPCAKVTGNGRATDSSRTWASGGGFSSRTSSIGPGLKVNIGCFETCNLPSVEGHSSGCNCRRSPFLCAQPATPQVSWPCASDQGRAGRYGHWIRHYVAVQPLPCWYVMLLDSMFNSLYLLLSLLLSYCYIEPARCNAGFLVSHFHCLASTTRQCPTPAEESKQIVWGPLLQDSYDKLGLPSS